MANFAEASKKSAVHSTVAHCSDDILRLDAKPSRYFAL
jgi:hypothetical protein